VHVVSQGFADAWLVSG